MKHQFCNIYFCCSCYSMIPNIFSFYSSDLVFFPVQLIINYNMCVEKVKFFVYFCIPNDMIPQNLQIRVWVKRSILWSSLKHRVKREQSITRWRGLKTRKYYYIIWFVLPEIHCLDPVALLFASTSIQLTRNSNIERLSIYKFQNKDL